MRRSLLWTGAAILLVTTYFLRMHKLTRELDTSQSKAGRIKEAFQKNMKLKSVQKTKSVRFSLLYAHKNASKTKE